ncbi:hypothetical protein, partial [Pseudomonas carnis]|uniref:hypothetical protein n=1 Tax=Pseudomonas carnis TaxID=2487355 RepID=UPI001E3318E6
NKRLPAKGFSAHDQFIPDARPPQFLMLFCHIFRTKKACPPAACRDTSSVVAQATFSSTTQAL